MRSRVKDLRTLSKEISQKGQYILQREHTIYILNLTDISTTIVYI